jgi:hypothetical protein
VKATGRGPDRPTGPPAGRSARVVAPHRQVSRSRRHSATTGVISGSSQAWCRSGDGSIPARGSWHRRQVVGATGTTRSQSSVGSRVAVGELALEAADLGPELVDPGEQGEDERPPCGRHRGGEFGRDTAADGSCHAANVAESARPDQLNCAGCEPLRIRQADK